MNIQILLLLILFSTFASTKSDVSFTVETSLRTTLQEVNADSGLVMLMDSAGNVIGKSSLSLLNGKSLEDEVYTTVRDMGTLAVPVSLIPVLEKGNVSLSDTVDVGNGIYNHNGKEIRDHNADMGGYGEITLQQAILFDSKVGVIKTLSPLFKLILIFFTGNVILEPLSVSITTASLSFVSTIPEIEYSPLFCVGIASSTTDFTLSFSISVATVDAFVVSTPLCLLVLQAENPKREVPIKAKIINFFIYNPSFLCKYYNICYNIFP